MGVSYVNHVIVEQAEIFRDVTWKKTNQILDTYYGDTATKGIVGTSVLIDHLLDQYFPPIDGEEMIGNVHVFFPLLETLQFAQIIARVTCRERVS